MEKSNKKQVKPAIRKKSNKKQVKPVIRKKSNKKQVKPVICEKSNKFTSNPLLVNANEFFKTIYAYNRLKIEKFLDVELTNAEIQQLKIPNYVFKLSQDFKIPLPELINYILRDFVIKFNYGEGKLKKSIWKNFQKITSLTPEQKCDVYIALFKK